MSSPTSVWSVEHDRGRLLSGPIAFDVELQCPERGLRIAPDSQVLRSPFLLGIRLPALSWQAAKPLSDAYTRGDDLVATYSETNAHPLRVQIYWRALKHSPSAVGFELMLSVQTHLLDSDPRLEIVTATSNGSSILPFNSGEDSFNASGQQAGSEPAAVASGCYLARMNGSEWSYLEMIHPGDHHRTTLSVDGGQCAVHRKLFERRLEKGVILRSRLQGLFIARTDDLQTAVECYRSFAASGPTLTA